jgi:dCMP deaminase
MRKPNFKAPKDWDRRWLLLAELMASFSKDPSTRVGAVAVRDRRVLSTGFNGMPTGVVDSKFRLSDRDTRLSMTVHAEMNVINFAARNGVSLFGSDLFIFPLAPCSSCASSIIQAGIRRVVVYDYVIPTRWQQSFDTAAELFSESGIALLRLPETEEAEPEEDVSDIGSKIPPSLRDIND